MTHLPLNPSKWSEFPDNYRAKEVAAILHWVVLGESGVVIGGSGSGKSNIAGYIAGRPDVTGLLLPGPIGDYCFLTFDLNSLPAITTSNFYRSLLYALQDALADDPGLNRAMADLMTHLSGADDPLALYLTLQRAHHLLIYQAGKQVIWLFDRFDEGCRRLEANTLNSLRNLRDQFKDKLSYVVFTRYPLARLRNPAEYDELHEILIMHTCWVEMMTPTDGRWVAGQVMKRYRTTFPEATISILYELCGGLPAFLKVAYSALANGELPLTATVPEWQQHLLTLPAIQRNCQEIWAGLLPTEQALLSSLAFTMGPAKCNLSASAYLQQTGMLSADSLNTGLQIFSPLFTGFVRHQQKGSERGITLHNGIVYRDGQPLPQDLAPMELRLLAYFLQHANDTVCTHAELEDAVWPYEKHDGISIERLTQLISRLRKKLEPGQDWKYILTKHDQGYQFVQPPAATDDPFALLDS